MLIARDRAETPRSTRRQFSPALEVRTISPDRPGSDKQDNRNCNASPDNAAKRASVFLWHLSHESQVRSESCCATAPRVPRRSQHSIHENTDTPCNCPIQIMCVNIQMHGGPW